MSLIGVVAPLARADDSPPLIGEISPVLVSIGVAPGDSGALMFNNCTFDFTSPRDPSATQFCPTCPWDDAWHDGSEWIIEVVSFAPAQHEAQDYSGGQFISELRFMRMAPAPGVWGAALPAACIALRRSRRQASLRAPLGPSTAATYHHVRAQQPEPFTEAFEPNAVP